MNKEALKKSAYFVGKSLGILGLIFVFYKLSQEYTLSSFLEQFTLLLEIFPLLLVLNLASILIGIYAWHMMLLHYAKKPFPCIASYYYFSKTEISKYLPGNIFHFIGRQALASNIGISQIEMVKISFLFTFLLLVGTVISSTFFALLSNDIHTYILILMGLSSVIMIIVVIYLYPSFPINKKIIMKIYLAISVALQGLMLGVIILYQSDNFTSALLFQCISIYIISWLIGFLTPGASGGLGIREGTFIAITSYLQINIASDIIIFSILLVRLINIFMDMAIYLSTFTLENKMKKLDI